MVTDQLKSIIESLPQPDFEEFMSWAIGPERRRRQASAFSDQAVTEVIAGLQDSGKITPPPAGTDVDTAEPWADPGTDHSAMYHQGSYVTYEGRTWLSIHPHLNHWPPGTLNGGWVDATPAPVDEETGEEQIIAWDTGQDIKVGDLRTHDGKTWRAKIDHVTHEGWAPSPATHAVWKPVTP